MANTAKKQMSAERPGSVECVYPDDPFASEGEHFIGHDGFVVPKDFDEFYARFPRYICSWVRKRLKGSAYESEAEDLTQELLLHMQSLPTGSKHRSKGKEDVIQTFDSRRLLRSRAVLR